MVAMLNHCMVRKTPYAAIPRFRRENSVLMHISRNVMQYDVCQQISATSASLSTEKLDLNICRQDFFQLENEVVFNEAVIEEREQGIQEIHQQIGEVNEIFKDLAVLVNEQGYMIGLCHYTCFFLTFFLGMLKEQETLCSGRELATADQLNLIMTEHFASFIMCTGVL